MNKTTNRLLKSFKSKKRRREWKIMSQSIIIHEAKCLINRRYRHIMRLWVAISKKSSRSVESFANELADSVNSNSWDHYLSLRRLTKVFPIYGSHHRSWISIRNYLHHNFFFNFLICSKKLSSKIYTAVPRHKSRFENADLQNCFCKRSLLCLLQSTRVFRSIINNNDNLITKAVQLTIEMFVCWISRSPSQT